MPEDDSVFKAMVQNYLVHLAIVVCPPKNHSENEQSLKRPVRSSGKSGFEDLEAFSINDSCQKSS